MIVGSSSSSSARVWNRARERSQFGAQRQALALDRGDALGAFEIGAAIQRHHEQPLAEQGLGAGTGETGGGRGDRVGVEAAKATHGAVGVIVGDDEAHRAVALGLDDQPALEFQAGADEGGQGAGLAQQGRDGFRISVGGQDGVDGLAETDQPSAHRPALDLEGGGDIVDGGGIGRVIGHEGSLRAG